MADHGQASSKVVTCLGGAGGMGRTLARHLCRSGAPHRLVVADLDGEAAVSTARELAAEARCEVVAAQVDALDPDSLQTLLADSDLLANAAGPFFRLGVPTLRGAIATGTPYVDICDDPQPTLDMLALDAQAKDAGVAALIGMGASPGLSNLMARRAADRLDEVEDCYTAWPLDLPGPGESDSAIGDAANEPVSAAVIHLMEQISGEIDVVEGGQLVSAKPLQTVDLDYPGLGPGSAVTVGHPEPVTLHRSLAVKGRMANLMLVKRSTAAFLRALGADIDRGRLTLEEAAEELLRPSTGRGLRAAVASVTARGHGSLPPFFALVTGRKGGRRRALGCALTSAPHGMDGITSVPAALAVEMLLENPAPPGVHAPEAVIDHWRLFDRLREFCPEPRASVDELVPLSEMELD